MANWYDKYSTTIPADVQAERDKESLAILQSERASKDTAQGDRPALDRQIMRRKLSIPETTSTETISPTPQVEAPTQVVKQPQTYDSRSADVGYSSLPAGARSLVAGTEGYLKGITANTSDYVMAGLAAAADRLRSKGKVKPISYDEALAAVRSRNADVKEQHPVASTVGNVAGAVHLGMGTGGASVPGAVAAQAAQGGVSKWAESKDTDLTDALTSAAISAGAMRVANQAGVLVNKAGRLINVHQVKKYADEMGIPFKEAARDWATNKTVIGDTLQAATGDVAKGTAKKLMKDVASVTGRTAVAGGGALAGGYVGGQVAPLLGIDKSTGQNIGAQLGGAGGGAMAWKRGLGERAAKDAASLAGFASSANRNFGSDAARAAAKPLVAGSQGLYSSAQKPVESTATQNINVLEDGKPWYEKYADQ